MEGTSVFVVLVFVHMKPCSDLSVIAVVFSDCPDFLDKPDSIHLKSKSNINYVVVLASQTAVSESFLVTAPHLNYLEM